MQTIFQSNAARFILAAWLASALYLAASGRLAWMLPVSGMQALILLLTWLSVRLTHPLPPEAPPEAGSRASLALQTVVLLIVVGITALNAVDPTRIPLWSQMVAWLQALGERTLPVEWVGGPGNAVANPVQYFVIPLLLLLVLGARPRSLGFARGHRSWRVCALWTILPALTWLALLIAGQLPPMTLMRRLLGNTLQNGFFEEFLFRGALYTRLNRLLPGNWALIGQALLFGIWHIGGNTRMMDGNLLAGLAACIVSQAVFGLAAGILFQRTRNLLAPSVMHVLMNAFGQTFG